MTSVDKGLEDEIVLQENMKLLFGCVNVAISGIS